MKFNIKVRLLLVMALLMMSSSAFSQGWYEGSPESRAMMNTYVKQRFRVTGRIWGTDDFEPKPYPLQGANVKVVCKADTTEMEGMSANKDGSVDVFIYRRSKLKDTTLHITISYIGMKTIEGDYVPKPKKDEYGEMLVVDLDSVVMRSNPMTTREVEVVAELKKMYQRGDTTIFNAEAVEMPPGSVLLDFVRRMPGLDYKDGALTYQDRNIEEIRLNGDAFFKRDMSIALNNMPHDKLKSLKVYEVPDDTMDVHSEEHLVMDMETKEPMEVVFFANAEAGTNETLSKYFLSGDLTRWKKNSGNISGNFSSNDIPSQGQIAEKVVNTNANLNFGHTFKHAELWGYLGHQYNRYDMRSSNISETYLPEFTQRSVNENSSSSKSKNYNGNASLTGTINKHITWSQGLNVGYSKGEDYSASSDSIINNDTILISKNQDRNVSNQTSKNFSWNGSLNINLDEERKNTLGFYYDYGYYDDETEQTNRTENEFLQYGDSVRRINHFIMTPTKTNRMSFTANFDHRFGEKNYVGVQAQFYYDDSKNNQQYNDILEDGSLQAIDSLNYKKKNSTTRYLFSANLRLESEKTRLEARMSVSPQRVSIYNRRGMEHYDIQDTAATSLQYNPNVNFRWKMGKNMLTLKYNCMNNPPSINQLSTALDYQDPMNQYVGNSHLKQAFSQNPGIEFQLNTWMRATFDYSVTHNSQTMLTNIDAKTGARKTTPVNINGNWRTNSYLFFTHTFHDIIVTTSARYNYSHNMSYVQTAGSGDPMKSASQNHTFTYMLGANYSDVHWIARIENQYVMNYQKSGYVAEATKGNTLRSNLDLEYNTSFGLQAISNFALDKRFGYKMASTNQTKCTWNIGLEYKFLKEKRAVLSVWWNDILNDEDGFSANMSATGWSESRGYGDTSYFRISFSYRFKDFH